MYLYFFIQIEIWTDRKILHTNVLNAFQLQPI